MAATKPMRGERSKKNAAKRVKPKTNPVDKKPKTTASKKAKPSKTALAGGNGKKKRG